MTVIGAGQAGLSAGHHLRRRGIDGPRLRIVDAEEGPGGAWRRPYWPTVPGMRSFAGQQLHTHDYPGPDAFVGMRVVVVGGGISRAGWKDAMSRADTRRPSGARQMTPNGSAASSSATVTQHGALPWPGSSYSVSQCRSR